MLGIDTNVLVRYFVQDDKVQAKLVDSFFSKTLKHPDSCFINRIVLCELVWVLESAYSYKKDVIADVLEKILITREFQIEDADMIWDALEGYRDGHDFADYLLGAINQMNGCINTITFDKKASKQRYFELLKK